MRNDNGYKLHVGALCPHYIESTMSEEMFNSILSTPYTKTCDKVTEGLRSHQEICLKLEYVGGLFCGQLDLTFCVSHVGDGETTIARFGLVTRAFPGFPTAEDIKPWTEKASVQKKIPSSPCFFLA